MILKEKLKVREERAASVFLILRGFDNPSNLLPFPAGTPFTSCTIWHHNASLVVWLRSLLEMTDLWPHLMRDVRVRDVPMRDVPALVGRTGDVRTGGKDTHTEKTLSHPCLFSLFPFCFHSLVVSLSSSLLGLALLLSQVFPFRSTQYKSTILIST